MDVQVFLGSGQRQAASGVRGEIAQVPTFQELAERCYPGMLLQGAEGRDAELAFVLNFDAFQFSVFVRFLFFDLSKKHLKIGQQRIICINLLSLRVPFPSMSLAFDHTEDQKRSAAFPGFISLVKEFIPYVGPIIGRIL